MGVAGLFLRIPTSHCSAQGMWSSAPCLSHHGSGPGAEERDVGEAGHLWGRASGDLDLPRKADSRYFSSPSPRCGSGTPTWANL